MPSRPGWLRDKIRQRQMDKLREKDRLRREKLEPFIAGAWLPGPTLLVDLHLLFAHLRMEAEGLTDWAEEAETETTLLADRQRYQRMAEDARRIEGTIEAFIEKWRDVL